MHGLLQITNSSINFGVMNNDIDFSSINSYKDINELTNFIDLLKKVEYVDFCVDIDSAINYISLCPFFFNKKIIFNVDYQFDINILSKIKDFFKDTDNVYFKIPGNYKLINFDEYITTTNYINSIKNLLNILNLSSLEKIMYVYDLLRERIYSEESENEDISESRDVSKVIKGGRIVCEGYANLFKAVLSSIGMKCNSCKLLNYYQTDGHAINEVYVRDEKYGIEGIYYFDLTLDSKKNKDDNDYFNNYSHFAMTRTQIQELYEPLIWSEFPYYSDDFANECSNIIVEQGKRRLPYKYYKSINYMTKLIKNRYDISFYLYQTPNSEIKENIYDLCSYFDYSITGDTLLKVLFNVRKNEYYMNPEKYPFTDEDFIKSFNDSDWLLFDNTDFILNDFLNNSNDAYISSSVEKYLDDNGILLNTFQIRFTRTLKNVLNKKMKD